MNTHQKPQSIWNSEWKSRSTTARPGGVLEYWQFRVQDPANHRSFFVRFSVLVSDNGFRKIAEICAGFFREDSAGEVVKTLIKQSHDLRAFGTATPSSIQIDEASLGSEGSRGKLSSQKTTIEWDFQISHSSSSRQLALLPKMITGFPLFSKSSNVVEDGLSFKGACTINGEKIEWDSSPGVLSYWMTKREPFSSARASCGTFLDENGKAFPFYFHALSVVPFSFGSAKKVAFHSFYFRYQEKEYLINSILDHIKIRSRPQIRDWTFRADQGDLSLRGQLKSDYRDFAGMQMEDSRGSLVYCTISELSDLTLQVYRGGKLEASLRSNGSASFEMRSRKRDPYVTHMI